MRRCDHGGAHCTIFRGSPGGDDYHSIWVDPKMPGPMAEGSDQGAAVTVNGNRSWSSWYNQPTGQFYHLAADNRFPYWIYSGQQDSGTVCIASRSDYGAPNLRDWHPVGGDERDYDIPDPTSIRISSTVPDWRARQSLGCSDRRGRRCFALAGAELRRPADYGRPSFQLGDAAGRLAQRSAGDLSWRRRHLLKQRSRLELVDHQPRPRGKRAGATTATAMSRSRQHCHADTAPSPRSSRHRFHPPKSGLEATAGSSALPVTAGQIGHKLTLPGIAPWSKVSSIDLSRLDGATAYVAVDGQRIDDWRPHVFARTTAVATGSKSRAASRQIRS